MISTTLRIDEKLYNIIIKLAEKDKRSINAEINYILEKYAKENKKD